MKKEKRMRVKEKSSQSRRSILGGFPEHKALGGAGWEKREETKGDPRNMDGIME